MARLEEPKNLEETVVRINRCTTVTKGGKSMSFSALVVVGDKKGSVGIGFLQLERVPRIPVPIQCTIGLRSQRYARIGLGYRDFSQYYIIV